MAIVRDVPHPSVFIKEEFEARGWGIGRLAVEMGGNAGINQLIVQMYFEVGPNERGLLLGKDTAEQLGYAFDVSPAYFLNAHNTWLCSDATL